MSTYILIAYLVVALLVAGLVAWHDYRRSKYYLLSAAMGGLLWPLTVLVMFLFRRKEALDAAYLKAQRRLKQKQQQQNYRSKLKRKSKRKRQ